MRVLCSCAAAILLAACASTPTSNPEQIYVGTVEKTSEVARPNQGGSPALYMFGLVGGLLNAALSPPKKTNLYVVKAGNGEVSAHSDERFAVGDCVEIVTARGAPATLTYAYGMARVAASTRCTVLAQGESAASGSSSGQAD
jgi:hypothetical protein